VLEEHHFTCGDTDVTRRIGNVESVVTHPSIPARPKISVSTEDEKVVAMARAAGIAILPDLLDADELAEIRRQFDQAYLDTGKGPGKPGTRDSISGEALLRYPALANLFIHPRILDIVAAILSDDNPWLWQLKTNRYTPEHPGVRKHTDGFPGEISPPFTRQAMAVFLDDISVDSGALTYVRGTHALHYEDPAVPSRQAPSKENIELGEYIPAELKAGSVLFRVPEVWHAVIPIHHLRRYVTGSYATRGEVSVMMAEKIRGVSEKRASVPAVEIPAEFRKILSY
jgi:ectoine hydroxylase-related dioxygenase (phytanoyl-CoA dioxygenase family)